MFENTKLGLSTWYLAMYLLTQSKNGISAMDLKRQLGVSYNSAWVAKHKLMQAMREREDSQPLRGIVELNDAYLGGEASGGAGRPASRPSGRGAGQRGRASGTAATEPGERLPAAGGGSVGAPAVTAGDGGAVGWAAVFPGVQAAGCEHQPRVTGGAKGSCETPGLSWVNTLLGNVKRATDGTYHSCSSRVWPTSPCALRRCPIGS